MQRTLFKEGKYFKGNLHTHSNRSDGECTPEQIKEIYKNRGYSFIAITDHNRYGIFNDLCDKDFLVVPGIEIDRWPNEGDFYVDHVVGIGHPDRNTFIKDEDTNFMVHSTPQELIDFLTSHNNLAIYAHPTWSYTDPKVLESLKGYIGMEIMNYMSEVGWRFGSSENYYEHLLFKNKNALCFSADDAHMHFPDHFGGYISVKCKELTFDEIFKAIEAGSFTASYSKPDMEAPVLHDFYVEGKEVFVKCSNCERVHILAHRNDFHKTFLGTSDKPITECSAVLNEGLEIVRCILIDKYGNTTWSQPIILK